MFLSKRLLLVGLLQYSLLIKSLLSADANLLEDLQEIANAACTTLSYNSFKCCGFCDYEYNCEEHGSCCLDGYPTLAHARDSVEKSRYGCVKPKYLRSKSDTDFLSALKNDAVWMITKCESTATDDEKELCENPASSDMIDSLVPVNYFGKIYRNIFCANCNGISNDPYLTNWRLEIRCEETFYVFPPPEKLLQTIKEERCNIFFRPPVTVFVGDACNEQVYTISECNVTGLWAEYNETVDKACNSYVDVFNMTYKNYFCMLCNTNDFLLYDQWGCLDPNDEFANTVSPPFVAILDLSAVKAKATNPKELKCKETQFADRKMMKCRDIFCDSRSYLEDGKCHSKNASGSVGSCIEVFVKLSFSPNKGSNSYYDLILMFNEHMQLVKQELLKELHGRLEEFALFSKRLTTEADQPYLILQMKFYVLDSERTVTFSHLIDNFENKTLTLKVSGHSETFESRITAYNLYLFDNSTIQNITVPNDDTTSSDILERLSISEYALVDSPCYSRSYSFHKLEVCPFIQLEYGELPFEGKNRLLIINESFLFQILESWEYIYSEYHVSICVADYKKIYDAMPEGITESDNFELAVGAKDTFSLVCVCLSVVCLLVTIITYVALTELHSQPGINTIILCVTLLLAQTIYQFGAGMTDGPKWSCVVIGAVCHFLWLSVMFAMNVCSYDMFRIFKNIQKLPTDFRWKDIIKRLSYIIVGSVLFVVINFVLSLSLSDGEDFGYGGFICYLSSTRMHLITFIVPSLFTIIANFVLFGYVVFKIGQNRVHAAKLGHERNYFGIYARLSTLTGLTWLIGYLQLLIKNEVLEYQFILLNAGQGIFIMFAFVWNRRIYGLIKDKLSMRKGNTDQHTQHTQSD